MSQDASNNGSARILVVEDERREPIEGLEPGADDYLTKPFNPRELVLRVQAILRRSRDPAPTSGDRVLRAGARRMDLSGHEVTLDGDEIQLTPTEFRLLRVLMEREVWPPRPLLRYLPGERGPTGSSTGGRELP